MADVFLWDETNPTDVVLRTSAPATTPASNPLPAAGATTPRRPRRVKPPVIPRQSAHIGWVVDIQAIGAARGAAGLAIDISGVTGVRGETTTDFAWRIEAPHTMRASAELLLLLLPDVELRHITDPPDLWVALDLPELADHGGRS